MPAGVSHVSLFWFNFYTATPAVDKEQHIIVRSSVKNIQSSFRDPVS